MSSSSTSTRRRAIFGGGLAATLVLAGGIAVWAGPGDSGTTDAAVSASATQRTTVETETAAGTPETTAVADTTTTVAAPTTTTPAGKASTPTTSKATPPTAKAASPTTTKPAATAAPAPAPAPAPAAKSGQRVNPTSAQVQAAITSLHQRIPLFEPNEAQLRTFADAACAQFDQGQTHAQVVETVRKAVTYIQGASLSAPDADFAVRTVLQLRCPGYL